MSEELRAYLMARRRALLQEVRWIEEALGLKGGQAEGMLRRPPARNDNGGRDDNVALSGHNGDAEDADAY